MAKKKMKNLSRYVGQFFKYETKDAYFENKRFIFFDKSYKLEKSLARFYPTFGLFIAIGFFPRVI